MLTKTARKRHLRTAGLECCPYCAVDNFNNIEYDEVSHVENGDILQDAKCLKCGQAWQDVFRLVDVHEIVK